MFRSCGIVPPSFGTEQRLLVPSGTRSGVKGSRGTRIFSPQRGRSCCCCGGSAAGEMCAVGLGTAAVAQAVPGSGDTGVTRVCRGPGPHGLMSLMGNISQPLSAGHPSSPCTPGREQPRGQELGSPVLVWSAGLIPATRDGSGQEDTQSPPQHPQPIAPGPSSRSQPTACPKKTPVSVPAKRPQSATRPAPASVSQRAGGSLLGVSKRSSGLGGRGLGALYSSWEGGTGSPGSS